MNLIKPSAVTDNATIGLFCPSSPAHIWFEDKYIYAKDCLSKLGFKVKEGEIIKQGTYQGYRTTSPRERAKEFMDLIIDPDIQCLMPVIGGNNTSSILPFLDYDVIRKLRKTIVGYSDITSLHMAVLKKSGLSTIYGPTLIPVFGEWPKPNPITIEYFIKALKQETRVLRVPDKWTNEILDARTSQWMSRPRVYVDNDGWHPIKTGYANGPLIIANLNTLVHLLDTEYCPRFDQCILLIEDMNVTLASFERNLTALRIHKVFDVISGLILSKPEKLEENDPSFTYKNLIDEVTNDYQIPIIINFDCGHTSPMISFYEMEKISIDVSHNSIEITEC